MGKFFQERCKARSRSTAATHNQVFELLGVVFSAEKKRCSVSSVVATKRMKRIQPNADQESVWDYPRPPLLEACSKRIRVVTGGIIIADSTSTQRVLETSHPPVYYIPPRDIRTDYLTPSPGRSFCEWKGEARYYSVVVPEVTIEKAAWYYSNPSPRFASIKGYVAFYPSKVDSCYVDDETVQAQEGDFYGGWVTSDIVGPFKGAPGTFGW